MILYLKIILSLIMNLLDKEYDFFWDDIESIEYIEPEDNEYVYDFSVDDVETFTTKEGLVVHNTLNSIDYNEKIIIRKNKSKIIVIKIGDFIERIHKTYNKKYQEYYETGDQTLIRVNEQNENYDIWAVDWNGNYAWKELQAVTKHLPLVEGKRDNLVKITLESKRTAIGTKAKSFLRYNPETNKIEQVGGEKIQIGDYVPITSHFKIPENEKLHTLNLEKYFPKTEYIYTDEILKIFKHKNSRNWKGHKQQVEEGCVRNKRWCSWFNDFNGSVFTVPYKRADVTIDGVRSRFKNGCFLKQKHFYDKNSGRNNGLKLPENIELDELFGYINRYNYISYFIIKITQTNM
jgi:hypothetical protein